MRRGLGVRPRQRGRKGISGDSQGGRPKRKNFGTGKGMTFGNGNASEVVGSNDDTRVDSCDGPKVTSRKGN